jgi:Tfp pilus assembly protein PilV
MISVSILSVGILALVTMQVSSIRVNNSASNLTEAIIMAQAQSERLISLPLSHPDLTDTDGDGNSGLDDDTSGTADHSYESDSIFSIFWNVASEEIISNTKTVNVIVTWNDKHLNLQRVIPGK